MLNDDQHQDEIQRLERDGDDWIVTSDAEHDAADEMEQGMPVIDADVRPEDRVVEPPPTAPPGPPRMRPIKKPVAPTRAQREAHELCHLAYATWCRFCVMARGQSDPHRSLKKHAADHAVPTVSGDFGFLTQV